jgi:hypothetical protein
LEPDGRGGTQKMKKGAHIKYESPRTLKEEIVYGGLRILKRK